MNRCWDDENYWAGWVSYRATDGDDRFDGDTMIGTDGADFIAGHEGNDVIDGSAGHDLLCGGQGSDAVSDGADNDIAFGGGRDRRSDRHQQSGCDGSGFPLRLNGIDL